MTPGMLGVLLLAGGCATSGKYQIVRPTPINQATTEIPESQLLNVGVAITKPASLSEQELEKLGTTQDIRGAESHYIPYHLKNTLQTSSHWGTVQVVPVEASNVDLLVTSQLDRSNGEVIQINVQATDASGRRWLQRSYQANVRAHHYQNNTPGEDEAIQDLYNTIANDLAAFKQTLTAEDLERIQLVSKLKFGREFAPDAYGEYLGQDDSGRLVIRRLPADDDPLMLRINKIRGRDAMLVDTLNQYYEGFYLNMWDAYENWRSFNLKEQEAQRRLADQAFWKIVGGAAAIAMGVALQVEDVSGTGTLSGILILAGGQIVIDGINVSDQKEIHRAAIQELAESFGSEILPTVVELEGKQYELTGTAAEQYESWKELLRGIYLEETGFDIETVGESEPLGSPGATSSNSL